MDLPQNPITHHVPYRLLWLWRLVCCRRQWHAWDEVVSPHGHYLHCDACEYVVDINDETVCECGWRPSWATNHYHAQRMGEAPMPR